jgi:hypothetical protein
MPPAYRSFAFSAALGDVSEPLQDPAGTGTGPYFVVRVLERADEPLGDEQKRTYQALQFTDWLDDAKLRATIVDKWTTDTEAQGSAGKALVAHATEKYLADQERLLTPVATVDQNLLLTATAENIIVSQTQTAAAPPPRGTPAPSAPDVATPAPTAAADGQ